MTGTPKRSVKTGARTAPRVEILVIRGLENDTSPLHLRQLLSGCDIEDLGILVQMDERERVVAFVTLRKGEGSSAMKLLDFSTWRVRNLIVEVIEEDECRELLWPQ